MKHGKFKKITAIGLALTMAVGLIYSSNVVKASAKSQKDGITINMFDYDAMATGNWKEKWNKGINKNHALKFTNGAPVDKTPIIDGNPDPRDYNVYQGSNNANPKEGIVQKRLGDDGYPIANRNETIDGKYEWFKWKTYTTDQEGGSLDYLFDTNNYVGKTYKPDVASDFLNNMLTKEKNHYYYASKGDGFPPNGFWPFGDNNVHFGMTMNAKFNMPSNGLVDGNEMVFNFNGDDDVWVFIDGALVLDLGGIHDTLNGSINFATGVVSISGKQRGTVSDFLEAAGVDSKYYNGKTLSSDVIHTIDFFYLERGMGGSNCKLDFYLPIIPTRDVTISKDVQGVNEKFEGIDTFDFSAKLNDNSLKAISYTKRKSDGTIEKGMLEKDNSSKTYKFTLKDSESIILHNLKDESQLNIAENQIKENDENKYNTTVNGKSSNEYNSSVSNIDSEIKYVNTMKDKFTGDLIVKKEFIGTSTNDKFPIDVKINDISYDGKYYKNGSLKESSGKIELGNNDYITIKDIPVHMKYDIQEILDEQMRLKYEDPKYLHGYMDSTGKFEETSDLDHTIVSDKSSMAVVQNELIKGKLTITKTIDNVISINGDPIFTFEIVDESSGEVVSTQSIRFTEEDISSKCFTKKIIIEVPVGSYYVRELKTLRYIPNDSNYTKPSQIIDRNHRNIEFTYQNDLVNKKNYSHTDILVNEFHIDDNGQISIEQNNLENADYR